MIKTKFTAALLAGMMLFGGAGAFAEESGEAQPAPAAAAMTVDDAIAYALEHSLVIASANSAITGKRYAASDARINKKQYEKSQEKMDGSVTSLEQWLLASGLAVRAAEIQLDIATRNLETEKSKLRIQVRSDFYTYLSARDKVEIARTNLKSAQEKLNYAKVKKDSGAISELDYASFTLSVQDAQNQLNQAERAAALAEQKIKFTINYPQENKLTLLGEFQAPSITVKDADSAISAAKSHVPYLNLQDSLTLAQDRWGRAQEWYTSAQPGYSTEKASFESAQADYQKNVNDLEYSIRSLFNELQNAGEQIGYTRENIALLQRRTDAAQLQYDLGMITANDLIDAQQQYFNAQNQLKDAELSYWIAALQYRAMYTYADDGSIQ